MGSGRATRIARLAVFCFTLTQTFLTQSNDGASRFRKKSVNMSIIFNLQEEIRNTFPFIEIIEDDQNFQRCNA